MNNADTNQGNSVNNQNSDISLNKDLENNSGEPKLNIPNHIAFIVDGNRRWAKAHNLPSFEGHRRGFDNLEKIMDAARAMGVKAVTAWVFSTENWNRSKEEVTYLFDLFRNLSGKYKTKFLKENTRFFHLGRKDHMASDVVQTLNEIVEETKTHDGFTASLAMDYGGHDELLRAMKKMQEQGLEITKENLESCLDTALLPPIDLIVRTGGEKRLSGFMSWQNHYAEFYFPTKFFPEFTPEDLKIAIEDYSKRERRFGGDPTKK
ncbi:di-trans,poly-cis-decaprenylcistransferase [candidate division WWE3 bacterium]|nr:di-trans,poly-cis-decaprenylcistransferase [candidate division WWE3 bacterium]